MEYRRFGQSGLKTSVISLGGWRNFGYRLNDFETEAIIHHAVANGVTTFDTADVYGPAEEAMGKALAKLRRQDLVLVTKCYWPISDNINDRGLSRKHITESVHNSLNRLQTDYIDLFLCHRFDEEVPLKETIRTFDDLIRQGKILYWGTSAWTSEQILAALNICDEWGYERPILEQSEYSLLNPLPKQSGLDATLEKAGMGLMCWSPLAAGILAGKNLNSIQPNSLLGSVSEGLSSKYHHADNIHLARQLQQLALELQVPMATLAINWLLAQSGVNNLVLGVSSLDQLNGNLTALNFEMPTTLVEQLSSMFNIPE